MLTIISNRLCVYVCVCVCVCVVSAETQRAGLVTSAGELVALLLTNILQDFMNIMRLYVPPSDIVRRIINTSADGSGSGSGSPVPGYGGAGSVAGGGHSSHTDSTLGEFKEVITSMVATDAQEYRVSVTMQGVCGTDVCNLLKAKGRMTRKGRRYEDLAAARRAAEGGGSADAATSEEGDKPLPKLPSSPGRRQLPSRPSSQNLNSSSAAGAGGSPGTAFVGPTSDAIVYTPSLLRERGRRDRVQKFQARMHSTLESIARSSGELPSYLKTRMVPFVDPFVDASALVRQPGTLPLIAMNTCEYSGVMND